MRNTLVSTVLIIVLGLLSFKAVSLFLDSYTASSVADHKQAIKQKEAYADFAKWARDLTPEQRDSIIQLRKAVRGY